MCALRSHSTAVREPIGWFRETKLNDLCSIHSTDYNAYVTKDNNGSVVMIALRDIRAGEEVRRYR